MLSVRESETDTTSPVPERDKNIPRKQQFCASEKTNIDKLCVWERCVHARQSENNITLCKSETDTFYEKQSRCKCERKNEYGQTMSARETKISVEADWVRMIELVHARERDNELEE